MLKFNEKIRRALRAKGWSRKTDAFGNYYYWMTPNGHQAFYEHEELLTTVGTKENIPLWLAMSAESDEWLYHGIHRAHPIWTEGCAKPMLQVFLEEG